MAKVK